jgi:LPXTG-motif cell wall-anchored protein
MRKFVLGLVMALLAMGTHGTAWAGPEAAIGATVVYVSGNDLLIKASDGRLLNYSVPAGYQFTIASGKVGLKDLKSGAVLTGPVATGSEPLIIGHIESVKVKVYASRPPETVTLILSDGSQDFTVPAGTMFAVNGVSVPLSGLKRNDEVEATLLMAGKGDGTTPVLKGALLVEKSEDLPQAGSMLPAVVVVGVGIIFVGMAMVFVSRKRKAELC